MTGPVQNIFLEVSPGEMRAAAVDEDGQLVALEVERLGEASLVGTICLARVTRTEGDSAFLDLGVATPGFLARAKGLHEGEALIVQISRDAWGGKGVAVTRNPMLSGRYLVLRPDASGLQWSRALNARARQALEPSVQSVVRDDDGVTVRTNAALAEPDDLIAEAERLRADWQAIAVQAGQSKAPSVLAPAPDLPDRLLRDAAPGGGLIADDRRVVAEMTARAKEVAPDLSGGIALHDMREPLFEAADVEDQIAEALSRRVMLADGANLVIDALEALTAIDVNLGGATGRRRSEDAIFRLNGAAADAAARQVMLRNIAGLVVIDFVSMRSKGNRRKLVERVRRAFADDTVAVDVLGMTPAGLVEVTRQRRGRSLADMMLQPAVGEASMRPAAAACAALRAVLRQLGAGRPVLRCAPDVARALEGALRPALDETARRLGQSLRIEADPACRDFEIVRER